MHASGHRVRVAHDVGRKLALAKGRLWVNPQASIEP